MRQLAIIDTSCLVEFGDFLEKSFREDQIDWGEVNTRIRQAIWDAGMEFKDVSKFVGLDISADDYMEKYNKLPKIQTAIAVSAFLGVPASWVLMGKGDPPNRRGWTKNSTSQSISDTTDSTVVQGNSAGTMIINNMGNPMSEQKRELLRIFDASSVRNQTKLLNFAYQLEDDSRRLEA